jgi:hypothetical protein
MVRDHRTTEEEAVARERPLKDGEHRAGRPEPARQPSDVTLSTEREEPDDAADDDRSGAPDNRAPGPGGHTAP